ncbi:MAG: DUF6089 family protein [Cyclobacteriaceae bacterium]
MQLKLCFLAITMSLSGWMSAQSFFGSQYNDRYFTINIGTGQTAYFGELNHRFSLEEGLSNYNLGFEARLLNHISARTTFEFYRISGDDSDAADSSFAQQRNLSFRSKNFAANLQAIYYLFPYNDIYHKRRPIEPFVALGFGFTSINPQAKIDSSFVDLRGLKTEGVDYRGSSFMIPIGLGAKFKLNQVVNLILEANYNLTFTDYLDDVSNTYGRSFETELAATLSNRKNEVGVIDQEIYDSLAPGGKRGNPNTNDGYFSIAIKLEFYLPGNLFSKRQNAAEN